MRKIVTIEDANTIEEIIKIREFLSEVAEGEYQPHDENGNKNYFATEYAYALTNNIDYLFGFSGRNFKDILIKCAKVISENQKFNFNLRNLFRD